MTPNQWRNSQSHVRRILCSVGFQHLQLWSLEFSLVICTWIVMALKNFFTLWRVNKKWGLEGPVLCSCATQTILDFFSKFSPSFNHKPHFHPLSSQPLHHTNIRQSHATNRGHCSLPHKAPLSLCIYDADTLLKITKPPNLSRNHVLHFFHPSSSRSLQGVP